MSKSVDETKLCPVCNVAKPISLFPKWRTKCKACKSTENSARLKERYASDTVFIEKTKQRAAEWQKVNAERANEYQRRRHAAKVAAGDREYLLKSSEATKRYYRSEKGKAATAARMKQYEKSGQAKEWRIARRIKPESRTSALLAGARNRAVKMSLEYNINFDDVYPAMAVGVCQKTGFTFDLSPHPNLRRHPLAPSIDRIDSSKGYIKGNVQVVCNWYNLAKQDMPEADMLTFCRAVVTKGN